MIESMNGFLHVAGGDILTAPTPVQSTDPDELRALLEAWNVERGGRVECMLLLGRVRRLLKRTLANSDLTDKNSREASHLLQMIELLTTDVPPDPSAPQHRRQH